MAEMTPRERWLALFEGREPDRVPTDYWATSEFHGRLKRDLGCETDEALWRRLHIDRPRYIGPRCLRSHHPDDPDADLWGVRRARIEHGTGAYMEVSHHPLGEATSVADIDRFRWPRVEDYDFSVIEDLLRHDDGQRLLVGGGYEPFLVYGWMRGLEQAFADLLMEPEIAEAALTHIFDFYEAFNRRLFEAARDRIDMFKLAEDLGGQTGPLMSLETYRRFFLPNQKRMADLVRSFGIHIFYHTDGAASPFLPDLVDEVGIEILNPIQWRCPGMERQTLVRDYGDRLIFHGAMDNQQTLPFGTPEDVRAEVRDNLRLFAGARWICAPCHNIQSVSPTGNIVAMFEEIHAVGRIQPTRVMG